MLNVIKCCFQKGTCMAIDLKTPQKDLNFLFIQSTVWKQHLITFNIKNEKIGIEFLTYYTTHF